MYNKTKTSQVNDKPTRKVVASSVAATLIAIIANFAGITLEGESLMQLESLGTTGVLALITWAGTYFSGYFKAPVKGDQVH